MAHHLTTIFDPDYLYFYEPMLNGDAATNEATLLLQLLNPSPGAKLLDAGCGFGRISHALAGQGLAITGVDAVAEYVDLGREKAREAGLEIDYRVGDLRSLTFDTDFDGAFMWFGSLGYFDDEGNRAIVHRLRQAVRPCGRVLIDCPNPFEAVRQLQGERFIVVERDSGILIECHRFDPISSRLHTKRTIIRNGTIRRIDYDFRLYTCQELMSLMRAAGLENIQIYAPNGRPFNLWSSRMIAVAEAPITDDRPS